MKDDIKHASGCAVHNEPAYPAGPCDCGAAEVPTFRLYDQMAAALRRARKDLRMWHMDTRYITEALGERPEPEVVVESVAGQSSARNDLSTADAGRVFIGGVFTRV